MMSFGMVCVVKSLVCSSFFCFTPYHSIINSISLGGMNTFFSFCFGTRLGVKTYIYTYMLVDFSPETVVLSHSFLGFFTL